MIFQLVYNAWVNSSKSTLEDLKREKKSLQREETKRAKKELQRLQGERASCGGYEIALGQALFLFSNLGFTKPLKGYSVRFL